MGYRARMKLSAVAIDAIVPDAIDALRPLVGKDVPAVVATAIVRRIVRAYVVEHGKVKVQNGRIAFSTRTLAAMQPEDVREIECSAPNALRSNMGTARALMGNPDARWSMDLIRPGLYRVERLQDGAVPRRNPYNNKKALELAGTPLNGAKTCVHIKAPRDVAASTKVQARRILGDDNADWRVRTTRYGAQVTRIA